MTLHASLLKAKQSVQRGHVDAALQIYRGLLRVMPKHPLVNSLLGALLIQIGQHAQAVKPLEIALTQEPQNVQHWMRLVAALYRSGQVGQARQLMAQGHGMGIEPDLMQKLEQSLSEPPMEETTALAKLMESGNRVSAEIAARMMLADYPDSATAHDCLERVLAMEVANAS